MLLYSVYKLARSCLLPFCACSIFQIIIFHVFVSSLFVVSNNSGVYVFCVVQMHAKNGMAYLLWFAGAFFTNKLLRCLILNATPYCLVFMVQKYIMILL